MRRAGGRRRAGDREVLAAVVFVATSGCARRQLPPVFGPAWQTVYRRFDSGARTGSAPGSTAWFWTSSGPGAGWTGRRARSIRSVSGRQKGASDGTESDRPWQGGIENPSGHEPQRTATAAGYLRRQHAQQPGPGTAYPRHPAHPLTPRPAPQAPCEATCGQGVRLRPPAAMAPRTRHVPTHRPERHRALATARPSPMGRRTNRFLRGRDAAASTAATNENPSTSSPSSA